MTVLLTFVFHFLSSAQIYYYKVITNYNHNVSNIQLFETNNRYFLISSGLCENFSCEEVIEINENAEYLWKTGLDKIAITPQTSFLYQDTIFLSGRNSPENDRTVFYKISLLDSFISRNEIVANSLLYDRFNVLNCLLYKNKIILTGQAIKDEKSFGIIMVLDKSLTVEAIISDQSEDYQSIVIQSSIGLDSLLTCFYYQVNRLAPGQVRRIVKYNDAFRPVWTYTSDTLYTNISYPNGIVLNDGRVVYVDYKPTWPTGLDGLKCLDTLTKQTSWRFDYPFQPSWGRKLFTVKQLRNGDIICTGKYTTKATTPRIEGSPYMMRIDTRGNMLWERAYVEIAPDGRDKGGSLWDVLELDNGDLMAVGYVTNINKWDPLLIRTDADGCIDQGTTNCPQVQIIDLMSGTVDEIGEDVVSIYPNPSYEGNVTIDIPNYDNTVKYSYSVQSSDGGAVNVGTLSQKVNALSLDMPSGLYIVSLLQDGKPILNQKWIVIR